MGRAQHRHAAGARGGNQDMSRTLAADSSGMTVRIIITEDPQADCKKAVHFIEEIDAESLLTDQGYDTSEMIDDAIASGMNIVFHRRKAVKSSEIMTIISTKSGILRKIFSYV